MASKQAKQARAKLAQAKTKLANSRKPVAQKCVKTEQIAIYGRFADCSWLARVERGDFSKF